MQFLFMIAFNIAVYFWMRSQNKQKRTTIVALGIDPNQQPLANEVSNYQLIYGILPVVGSNCTWYGDYSTFKVYEEVKSEGGLFGLGSSSEKVQSANGYKLGFCLSLGYGEQRLYGLKVNDKYIYQTNTVGYFEDSIELPNFFGKLEQEGGLVGKFRFYAGTQSQTADSYMQNAIGETIPAYLGKSYIVFEKFYIGNNNSITPITSIVGRYPKVSFLDDDKININKACNPINIVCDLLTNKNFSVNLTTDDLNVDSFYQCQSKLHEEQFGLSFGKFEDSTSKEIIDDVNRTIDGQLRERRSDGKIEYKLNRQDYDFDLLYEFNDDNIISVVNYSTNASSESLIEYKVTFTDVEDNFKQKITTFQNDGKYSEIRQSTSRSADYLSVNSLPIARMIARRDALPLTQQFIKLELKLGDVDDDLNVGDVVAVNLPDYKIKKMAMRVTSIDLGDSADTSILLKLSQDITSKVIYSESSPDSRWQEIDFEAKDVDLKLIDAPYFFTSDSVLNTNRYQVITTAKNISNAMLDYTIYSEDDVIIGKATGFTPETNLYSSIGRYETDIVLSNDATLTSLVSDTETNIRKGYNLALITEGTKFEWISFINISSNILSSVKRGLLDSKPEEFSTSAVIRFISYGYAITENESYTLSSLSELKAKTRTVKEELDLSEATLKSLTVSNRSSLPILASNLKVNTQNYEDTIEIGLTDLININFSFKTKQKNNIQYYTDVNNTNTDSITHKITFYNTTTNAIIKEETISNNNYTFSDEATFNSGVLFNSIRMEIKAVKDGLDSIIKYNTIITRV